MSIVYLNGEFLPVEQARISPMDRGFIFADGIYEVIPVYGGRLFRLTEHLKRLQQSLEGIRLDPPFPDAQWSTILNQLVHRNGGGDLSIYLQVTRGVASRDHAIPDDVTPTIFAMSNPLPPLSDTVQSIGIAAITLEDIRWKYCHIKSVALLPNVLLRQQAREAGAVEAILVREGRVTEGAASNLFIVAQGEIITPPKGPFLLPGITRDLILELAKGNAIPAREGNITPQRLHQADEIWITSSTREILPVIRLDGREVGSGQPGPVWERMFMLYQDYKKRYCESGNDG